MNNPQPIELYQGSAYMGTGAYMLMGPVPATVETIEARVPESELPSLKKWMDGWEAGRLKQWQNERATWVARIISLEIENQRLRTILYRQTLWQRFVTWLNKPLGWPW